MSPALEPGSDSTARHACHCGKSFAHKEHLTRHQATHEKLAYICTICQRRFSRKDVLRRHSILHENSHTRIVVSCDACRANKTKCSGGAQCSLCTRRGINCTFQSGLHRSQSALTSDGSTAVNASVSEEYDDDDASMLPTSTEPETSLAEYALRPEGELLQHNVEFLQNLTIVPSTPGTKSEIQLLSRGMEAIHELLVIQKSSLYGAIQELNELEEWVIKCLTTYSKSFHLRWPILLAPTLEMDIPTMSLPLAASVCVIGAWFQSSADGTARFHTLRVHDFLLQHLLRNLIDHEVMSGKQAWPVEFFQAVLLTLIFSLYRTDKSALSRATLLQSTFITLLRELGAFDAELLAEHLKTYFSGTYVPFTLSNREKFKRLLVSTYQFDAYFALAHGKPPILHRQEIGVCLPSTFASWNPYGLDKHATRQSEEPPGRSDFRVSEMTTHPASFTSSQLLVEDVQLGLCGLLQAIWVSKQCFPPKTKGYLSDSIEKLLLIETLDDWKHELDTINASVDAKTVTSNAARYMLLAYRGEDDSVAAALERITSLVQDGMVLYYHLKMYHYVGLGASAAAGPLKQTEEPRTEIRRTSKYGREALVCALQLLKLVESIGASGACLNPLIRHGLAIGVNVTRLLLSCQKCEQFTKEGQDAAGVNLQQWTETGGPLWIDGTPVCVCKLKYWTERFEKAIQDQNIMVE